MGEVVTENTDTACWFVLAKRRSASLEKFVDYWERFYADSKSRSDDQFLRHLKWKGGRLTSRDVEWLFRWKYRDVPNWSAKPTIRQLSKLNRLRFTDSPQLVKLATSLSPNGLVKRVFRVRPCVLRGVICLQDFLDQQARRKIVDLLFWFRSLSLWFFCR